MGLVLLTLPPAYMSMRKLNFETDTQVRSSLLASAELERMRTLEYSELELLAGTTSHETEAHPSRENILFATQTEVKEGDDELDGMLEVVVTVSWMENSRLRKVVGRAFFAKNGLSDKKFDDAN